MTAATDISTIPKPGRAIDPGVVGGRLIARNAVWSFSAEIVSIIIGLLTLPFIIRGLGTDSFGVLSLAWVLLGYFGMFDLGLSRAATKLVSEALGKGETQSVPQVIGTTLTLQLGLGLVAGIVVAVSVPYLATRVLRIPIALLPQAESSFYILAACVPVVLTSSSLRGTLEALQRFDLISYVRIPTNSLMFLCPVALLPLGVRLRGIVLAMALVRTGAMLAYFVLCLRLVCPSLGGFSFHKVFVKRLAGFGSWITVSNVAGPILVYVDRFVLGSMMSVSAVAYYAAPADMVNRLLVLPSSLSATLFPAFSTLNAGGEEDKRRELFARALKFTVLVLGPSAAVIAAFSPDILRLWLGAEFAQKSATALAVLALAVFVNGLAFFPSVLLQGVDKPEVTALFHVIELPVYLGTIWFLVDRLGILGAALACAIRVGIDSVLLFGACFRFRLTSFRSLSQERLGRSAGLVALFAGAVFLGCLSGGMATRAAVAVLSVAMYVVASWWIALSDRDRGFFIVSLKAMAPALAAVRGVRSALCDTRSTEGTPQ